MQEKRFAGVDWASEEHAVCVVDQDGRIVEGRRYRHDERGIGALCERLLDLGVELVAIERPDGLLIDRLLDAGPSVIAVHPNQVAAMRPRFSAAGGKSDNFDAFVLAELARTDSHRFRILVPDSDRTKALRAMTRAREDLVGTRVALANELRAQLECFWPGASKIFAELDSPIALAFLARYPSPADARGLGEQRLAGFLARHGYSGRRTPGELLSRLRGAAEGRAGELEGKARRQIVLALLAGLEPLVAQISDLTRQLRAALHDHARQARLERLQPRIDLLSDLLGLLRLGVGGRKLVVAECGNQTPEPFLTDRDVEPHFRRGLDRSHLLQQSERARPIAASLQGKRLPELLARELDLVAPCAALCSRNIRRAAQRGERAQQPTRPSDPGLQIRYAVHSVSLDMKKSGTRRNTQA